MYVNRLKVLTNATNRVYKIFDLRVKNSQRFLCLKFTC